MSKNKVSIDINIKGLKSKKIKKKRGKKNKKVSMVNNNNNNNNMSIRSGSFINPNINFEARSPNVSPYMLLTNEQKQTTANNRAYFDIETARNLNVFNNKVFQDNKDYTNRPPIINVISPTPQPIQQAEKKESKFNFSNVLRRKPPILISPSMSLSDIDYKLRNPEPEIKALDLPLRSSSKEKEKKQPSEKQLAYFNRGKGT